MLLAVGGVAALFVIPIPTPTVTNTSTLRWSAPAGSSNSTELTGPAYLDAGLDLRWSSSAAITLRVYTSNGCTPGVGGCPAWQLVASTANGTSGEWTSSGPLRFPFLISWGNPGPTAASVLLTTVTTQAGSAALSPLSELLLGLGVGALAFVGGLALFLGFFLRGGVYGSPAPLVSRSAEDVEEIAGTPEKRGPPPAH